MLTAQSIADHPDLRPLLRQQASAFLGVQQSAPKAAAVFATLQRYLLAQLAAAMAFESGSSSFLLAGFLEKVREHQLASRNTAHSFIKEMLHYGLCTEEQLPGDRRKKPIVLSPSARQLLGTWVSIHLATLDGLDGGARSAWLAGQADHLARLHPRIVKRILASKLTVRPEGVFALFTWMNDGGLAMDKLVTELDSEAQAEDRVLTSITTFDQLCAPLRITRTHLARKMSDPLAAEHIGWTGRPGASRLWVSHEFIGSYYRYQCDKLAHVEGAFEEARTASPL
ncbi:hypothetical protein [Pannonibacter sp. SL95]|uniref:hypothetical protein n=1 Tax=Pannonibacter sp. SL95 TaxID=2995153 RepID=UPI0022743565|nr:hypothetical protein [Pannonibacter sp. SL95]MCY1708856.1 hypothetical protein [Pannonibacter sp. SL95]